MVDDDFTKMVEQLQKKIEHEEEKKYLKIVINEYRNPTNFGVLKHSNAVGVVKGSCGDTMKITLKIVNKKIKDARFWTDGCGATLACGNILTKTVKGKETDEALKISQQELINSLNGLPKKHDHCAKLAIITLHEAINKYYKKNTKMK